MTELILSIALFGSMGTVALILSFTLPALFDRRPAVVSAKAKLEEYQLRDEDKVRELAAIKEELVKAEGNIVRFEKELKVLVDRRKTFPKEKPLPVVEHGQAILANKCFEAFVHNNGVVRARRLKQTPPVNPFWEEPRYVVVWAEGLNEARAVLIDAYPTQAEWHVEMRGEVKL